MLLLLLLLRLFKYKEDTKRQVSRRTMAVQKCSGVGTKTDKGTAHNYNLSKAHAPASWNSAECQP